ncbi:MAG TPA: GNAT family N-acetyltransferase [Myxococcota bacterium]|nr:GNAT family N-acetyltransferase [Myxococcota bacterium]
MISSSERIERENDPDCSSGPRLFFAGCPQGNIARVRRDVEDQIALSLLAIAVEEPPWRDPDVLPQSLGKVIDLLSLDQQVVTIAPGVIYRLPNGLRYEHPIKIVRGDSAEGEQMLARFADRGLPQSMLDAGFKGVGDFWEPWCVALGGDEIASIGFAARIGDLGAEIGVYTFPKFRAQGFAAAVTASWSSLPCLKSRTLFYSTQRSNSSSQRVAARLGLRRIGASVRIC